jgi:hypothetical protein
MWRRKQEEENRIFKLKVVHMKRPFIASVK